jgi:hypothetical protein
MGMSQEVARRDSAEPEAVTPGASPQSAVVEKAAETTAFIRRPDGVLNTGIRPASPGVVIDEDPIEVIHTTRSIPDPDVIRIAQPFESKVNTVLSKLDEYAKANGAQVEPSSVRSSSTGPISWLLTRKGIAEWVRSTFPVEAFDLTRVQADGTTRKVCQVQIAKGFFSGKVQVTVPRYPGGETEGDAVEIALGLKRGPSRGAARPEIAARGLAAGDVKSKLGAEVRRQAVAQTQAVGKLGLSSKATGSDISELNGLVASIERDVAGLCNGDVQGIQASRQSNGTYVILSRGYKIRRPDTLPNRIGLSPSETALAISVGLASGIMAGWFGVAIAPPIALLSGFCFGFLGLNTGFGATWAALEYRDSVRPSSYLRDPLRSKEPGSLGVIVEKLREAGLGCDIRVGAWDRKKLRVDLTVSFKPTEEA